MALSVNTNIAALNAYRNLSATQNDLGKSLEKLSSGLRINRAADDAAGLAISEGLRAQIGGTTQAVRNAQDGISVVQTAEGALTETHSILQRMRTLSVQASNEGGLSDTAKSNIQDELGELKTELTRIADTTQFNGKKLLDGKYDGSFQVGANTSAQDKINVKIETGNGQGLGAVGLGVANVDVTTISANATTVANTTSAASGTAGVKTLGAAVDFTGDNVQGFKDLNGTVTIGSKSLDLKSVDYTGVTTTAGAETALNAALTAKFGAGAATAAATATGITLTGATTTGTAAEVAATEIGFKQASGADRTHRRRRAPPRGGASAGLGVR